MGIEYIGKLLPDGHISLDPSVLPKIQKGEKLRIKIETIETKPIKGPDPATKKILARLKNAPKLGKVGGQLRREEIYEERFDEKLYPLWPSNN
jgi:hypothetical protein